MSDIPVRYQPLFQRIQEQAGRSKSDCIKAFCLQCVGFQYKRVRQCISMSCPLHSVRPYQVKE